VEQPLQVLDAVDGDARAPDLAVRHTMIGVVAHLRRQVERHREPGLAGLEQMAKALVGFFSRAEARVLTHRPKLPAVHRGIDPAGIRRLAGSADVRQRTRLPVVRHVSASTDRAKSTSRFEPMISGVRWCSLVGVMSRMSFVPSIAAPPACSTTNDSGAAS